MNRIIFHVKRQYYESIKRGEKTSEWRDSTAYWLNRLIHPQRKEAWFVAGYPKNNLPRLEAEIVGMTGHAYNKQIEIKISNVKEVTV